jgi:hypothetical protein
MELFVLFLRYGILATVTVYIRIIYELIHLKRYAALSNLTEIATEVGEGTTFTL